MTFPEKSGEFCIDDDNDDHHHDDDDDDGDYDDDNDHDDDDKLWRRRWPSSRNLVSFASNGDGVGKATRPCKPGCLLV